MKERQRLLWRHYSFDVIPLEFISSVYEEFVTSSSAHYTPGFLVDFILDGVLPWNGEEWDLKILDPACGSGIFLVKAYQRLIQRWKNAHPGETPGTPLLRKILERNLFGVDIDPHAVRVASFSLYLTMCDEVDPKNYLRNTKFPRLRGNRLVHSDFFVEGVDGFDTTDNASTYDLVIGNSPWGKNSATHKAKEWAKDPAHAWEVANNGIGTLFLAKSAALTKDDGYISLIQPAGTLLFNRSGPTKRFREKFFSTYKVSEVVNLSTLRFELFENAVSPPCIVTFSPIPPDGEPITYVSPKQGEIASDLEVAESSYSVIIEPSDIAVVPHRDAVSSDEVWTALAWGGRRDFALIQKLKAFDSLEKLKEARTLQTREGIIRGDRGKSQDILKNRRILLGDDFPTDGLLVIDAESLPLNTDLETDSKASTQFTAFESPQLFIKQSWTIEHNRFRAVLVDPDNQGQGALCTQSYISAHAEDRGVLASAVLTYNSRLAVYFLLLTSGRLASYRPEPLVEELRRIPIPSTKQLDLRQFQNFSEIDEACTKAFALKDSESILIDDLFEFTMADFKGDGNSPGRLSTARRLDGKQGATVEPQLTQYCEYFLRVLKAASGNQGKLCATIFQDTSDNRLPVRLVAFYLDMQREDLVRVETIDSDKLCDLLNQLDEKHLRNHGVERGGIFFQRVARIYNEQSINGENTPIVYIVKPDRVRYWTRSAGLRDADEVAADVQLWNAANPQTYEGVEE